MNYSRNYTLIDQLPELQDIEGGPNSSKYQSMIPSEHSDQIQKLIRNSHLPPSESGMYTSNPSNTTNISELDNNIYYPQQQTNHNYKKIIMPSNTPSCIVIAEHIQNCPICSKFYNNDKTIYIAIIIALMIVCILLFQKILSL